MKWIWYADWGNWTLHWGAWAEHQWHTAQRVSVRELDTPDGKPVIAQQLAASGLSSDGCQQAVVCVSAPAKTAAAVELAQTLLDTNIQIMGRDFLADLPTEYYDPTQIGQDRLANALAAMEMEGCPVVVLDFGSCLTCDAVSADGVFLGGAIAPGLPASRGGIADLAPHLRIEAERTGVAKDTVIVQPGRTTTECLSLGLHYGLAGAADRLVAVMREYLADEAPVVATGGDAPEIAPLCQTAMSVEVMLTLDGLRLAYSHSQDR